MPSLSPPGGSTRQVQQGWQFPRRFKYLHLLRDIPSICWLLMCDCSGDVNDLFLSTRRNVRQGQRLPRQPTWLQLFQDMPNICWLLSHVITLVSDRLLPTRRHNETSPAKPAVSKMSQTCVLISVHSGCLLVFCCP